MPSIKTLFVALLSLTCLTAQGDKECGDPKLYKNTFADMAEKFKDSVVNIAALRLMQSEKEMAYRMHSLFVDPRRDYFGTGMMNPPQKRIAFGSGFVIKQDADTYYVVTNHHVVEDSVELRVVLTDESIHKAELVGKESDTDIAVLKFTTTKEMKPLKWGDSDKLRIGEWSIVLGNPYGLGGTSLSTGVISYLARDLGAAGQRKLIDNYIQTEAPINPGNSGGPLLNLDGEVIGVNNSAISASGGNDNVGFAIPQSLAQDAVNKIIGHREAPRAWLGATAQSLNKHLAEYLHIPNTKGAMITKVIKGSPADTVGMQMGDVVTSINGKPLKKYSDLLILGKKLPIGKEATFEIIREGKKLTLKPLMQAYKDHESFIDTQRFKDVKLERHLYNKPLGFGVTDLTPQFRQRFDIIEQDVEGVLIANVKEDGIAGQFTLMQGDILIAINGKTITRIEDVNPAIEKHLKETPEKPILFLLHRAGSQNLFVAIDPRTKKSKKK